MQGRSRISQSEWLKKGPGDVSALSLPIEFLLTAFDNYNIGVAVCDKRLRFTTVNRALSKIHNLSQESHIGKALPDVLGTIAAKAEQLIVAVFETGQAISNVELSGQLTYWDKDGRWIKNYFPLRNSQGHVEQVGVFVVEMKLRPPLLGFPAYRSITAHAESLRNNVQETLHAETHQRETAEAHQTLLPGQSRGIVLSGREHEVLRWLAVGKSNKEISSILVVSVKTIETYRSRIMLKLHARSLTHLVHYAIHHKIVDLQF